MSKFVVLFFIGFCLSVKMLNAQETVANSIEFTPQISLGVFTANQKISGQAYGGELIYHLNTEHNAAEWMRSMNLKSIDFSFIYKNMNNVSLANSPKPDMFGDSYSVLAGLNITLMRKGKTELLFSPAFGLGYAGETFFTNENPIVGSHIGFTSKASLKIATSLSPVTKAVAGIDIVHSSNAGFRVPNNGVNVASVSVGIIQSLKPLVKTIDTASQNYFRHKTHTFDFGINIGRRGVYQSKEGFFRTGLYTGYNYRVNSILALSSGIDAVYYHSVFNPNDFNRTYQSFATSYDHWRIGAALGPDIWMGRLALMVKYGYYLHYNSFRDNHTYWTAGMKYGVNKWLAAQAKIYIHKTEADFVGFGLMFTPLSF